MRGAGRVGRGKEVEGEGNERGEGTWRKGQAKGIDYIPRVKF